MFVQILCPMILHVTLENLVLCFVTRNSKSKFAPRNNNPKKTVKDSEPAASGSQVQCAMCSSAQIVVANIARVCNGIDFPRALRLAGLL